MQRPTRLSFLISALLAATLTADVALRRTPIEQIAFRAWEAAQYGATSLGAFRPDFHYANPRVYGDLANLGNFSEYREYRAETFTTDKFGFRNLPSTAPVRLALLGDSFSAGAALSDDETLSAQFTGETGARVYNAAGAVTWPALAQVMTAHRMRGGVVLLQVSEGGLRDQLDLSPSEARGITLLRENLSPARFEEIRRSGAAALSWVVYSPLKILLTRTFHSLQNDRWLPRRIEPVELSDGHRMLFFVDNATQALRVDPSAIRYFVEAQNLVRQSGNELLVVMAPTKYRVYRPLMKRGGPIVSAYRDLVPALEKAGVRCIDLTPILTRQAEELSARGQYNFRDDDTHWNPTGVRCAARAIAEIWEKLPVRSDRARE
jgi:SGNH hydrolase-like domain, acetyltransferase AlgX